MKNKKKIWIIAVSIFLFIIIVLPAIAFSIVKWGVLPPEKLTPLVVREVNKLIDGQMECERIELTFWETYPRLGVRLRSGSLVSYATRDSASIADDIFLPSDSLISFSRALISVNPLDYLKRNKKITIGAIFIENPKIYGYINPEGKANWEIYQSNPEEEDEEPLPPIDLQRIRIKDGLIVFDDRQSDMYTEFNELNMSLNGSLTDRGNRFEIETSSSLIKYEDMQTDIYTEITELNLRLKGGLAAEGGRARFDMESSSSSILFDSPSYTLNNKLAIGLKSKVTLTDEFSTVRLDGAEMMVNNLPFKADGKIVNLPDSAGLQIDMDMQLTVSDMNDLLDFVPDEYFQDRKNMQAKGSVLLESNVHGLLNDSVMPTINLCCKIENGSYFMKGVKQGIESFEVDMDLHLNGTSPDSSYVVLEKLTLEGLGSSFSLRAKVTDILQSPAIDGYMKGTIDFTRLAEEFLNPDTLSLTGKMDADILAEFLVDDLLDGRYNRVKAAGVLHIDQLEAHSKPSDMELFLSGVHFSVDSTKQTSSFLTNEDLMSAALNIDSMAVRYKDEINTNVSRVEMTAKTSTVIDTTAVMPVTTHIKVGHLRTRLPDSVWVVAVNSYLRGGIKPSTSDKTIPMLGAAITIDTLRYFDIPIRTGTVLTNNTFGLEALPYRDARRQQRAGNQANQTNQPAQTTPRTRQRGTQVQGAEANAAGRDSTQRRSNRDSNRTRERTERSDSVQSSGSGSLLRNWEVRGSLAFDQMRIFSRMFPLPMRMEKTNLKFDTNTITLTNAKFHAGKSDFLLNGEVNDIRRALLRGEKIQANLSLNSDYIDCNELLQAANKGMAYMDQALSSSEEVAIADGSITEIDDLTVDQDVPAVAVDTSDVLLVVPDFLDMTLRTRIKKIDYDDVNIENVRGEIVVRNQSINLRRLHMDSNIGQADVTLFYTAKDRYKGTTGFELDMNDILVERLVGIFPAIDSLLPMLRSFEGVVDCQMAATCDLDSTMSIVLPSLHSACYLHGEDMVLLDGETFAEISKTLMFKNKNRNVIDSISVDLLIKDNKIEVYPFLIEMDRYRVAVGGTHNLDLTFDYHLSVLKSPVPFKLGVDVKGDLDNFKYKIVKCRYKDIFKPAREAELDETRANLRVGIRDVIRKEIQVNAPELAQGLEFRQNFRPAENIDRPNRENHLRQRQPIDRTVELIEGEAAVEEEPGPESEEASESTDSVDPEEVAENNTGEDR